MDRNEMLAWIGILIGVPGLALIVFSGQAVIGLLVFIIICIAVGVRWTLSQSPFTILEVEKVLTFHDPQGQRATLVRTQKARANHKGLTEYWCKNIGADGQIQNILVDKGAPAEVKRKGGDTQVCKRFAHPLERGQVFMMELSYDLIDSFPAANEGFSHVVEYKTKKLKLSVTFDPGKRYRATSAFLYFGGQVNRELGAPTADGSGLVLRLEETSRIKLGGEYSLEWEW